MRKTLKKLAGFVLAGAMLSGMGLPAMASEADFTASEIVAEPGKLDVYLCIGQSNMAGRAEFEAQDLQVLDRTYLLTADGKWEKAKPVMNAKGMYEGLNRNSTVKDETKHQGLNPAFYMAKTIAANVGEDVAIGIVGNARGDTSINRWQPDDTELTFGEGENATNLYKEALAQAKKAVAAGGTIKGIIWHHGCANAGTTGYTSKFKTMVESFRTDLGISDLPVFMGEIPGFGDVTETTKDSITTTSYQYIKRQGFNGQFIKGTAEAVDNCYYISSIGLEDGGDNTHFNSYSQRELGKRYAQIVLDKIYGIADNADAAVTGGFVTAENAANAVRVQDGTADVHNYVYDSTLTDRYYFDDSKISKISAFPAEYVLDYGMNTAISQLDTYFADPYRYIYQYKIYTKNDYDLNWKLAADNSAQTRYANVAYDGAVIDKFSADARYIKVVITGAVDYKGNAVTLSDGIILGVNEFAARGAKNNIIWRESFEGYETGAFTASGDISYSNKSANGTLTIENDNNSKVIKLAKPQESGKDYIRFDYKKSVSALNTYTVKFRMKAAKGSVTYAFNEGQSEARGASMSVANNNGNIQYYHEVNNKTNQTASASQWDNWNDYTIVVKRKTNTAQNCWDLYMNDILIAADIPARGKSTTGDVDFGRLDFYIPSTAAAGALYIDDIMVIAGEPDKAVKIMASVDGQEFEDAYPAGKMSITVAPTAKAAASEYVMFAAEYDDENTMINVRIFPMAAGTNKASSNMTVLTDTSIKFMMFDSVGNCKPLKDAMIITGVSEE